MRPTWMVVPGMSPSMKFAGSIGVAGWFTLVGSRSGPSTSWFITAMPI